jgi:hypothetical protein
MGNKNVAWRGVAWGLCNSFSSLYGYERPSMDFSLFPFQTFIFFTSVLILKLEIS